MKLFWSPPSPFARIARVSIAEKGLAARVELLDAPVSPVTRNEAVIIWNPLGKIPCLLLEDGKALYDSRVITRYLDGLAETPALYPEGEAQFETLKWEALANGVLDAAVLCVYEERCRDENHRSQAWLDGQRCKITAALDVFEAQALPHLKAGTDAAAIAVGCTLAYLDFRQPVPDWRPERPGLSQWFEAFAKRESMLTTQPV